MINIILLSFRKTQVNRNTKSMSIQGGDIEGSGGNEETKRGREAEAEGNGT